MADSDASSVISDASADPEFEPFVLPDVERVNIFDLRQALENLQKLHQQVLTHNRNLRLQNSDLKSQLSLAKARGKGKKSQTTHDPYLNHDLILKLGKKYTIMVHPWASSDMFDGFPPKDSPEPESSDRFKDINSFDSGLIKELHIHLNDPELCAKAAEYAPFKHAFLKQAKQGRTAAVHTLRDCISIILAPLNVPSTIWVTNARQARLDSAVLVGQLQFPGHSASTDALSPILYPNGQKINTNLFLNEYQPKIIRCLLFGKQSLSATKFKFGPSLLGMNWGVKHVNNSCIALSAIMLRFMLSDDEEFVATGKWSKINYCEDFFTYRQLLNSLEGSNYLKGLYAFYNTRVFAGLSSNSGSTTATASDAYVGSVAEALLAIRLADSEPALLSVTTATAGQPEDPIDDPLDDPLLAHVDEALRDIDAIMHPRDLAVRPNEIVDQAELPAVAGVTRGRRGRERGGRGGQRGRGHEVTLPQPDIEELVAVAALPARTTRTRSKR